ncbi:amphi-Trp domain-containing protein [Streptomyces europaeiscabiei]|uniref:amphi-Trp domain-containing protein n=1 Tax=Streptomyces europaeiscabiei TaxID=146819 RepID=UPI0029BF4762|nr:amphi-Trp domain-containing protein [Streptomyces europaeiscabiei]MDX3611921.1 amphi-Trp domain-containing protein [Streptomyces europaeiscabiei]WUD33396.1 amphi-Trp domain-containing protein [Streptomyces europaeiscabiei]
MRDLKFEQKRSLSRLEAADQLTALAAALREGGEADVELGHGTLSLRIPDDLRSEVEVEIGDGEIELEIEFKWPTAPTRTAPTRTAPSRTAAGTGKATRRKNAAAKPARSSTGTSRSKTTKPSATKTPGAVPETSGRPTIAP